MIGQFSIIHSHAHMLVYALTQVRLRSIFYIFI